METQEKKPLTKADLHGFTGTTAYHRLSPLHKMTKLVTTDGVAHVAEKGGAYWLIDLIAFELVPMLMNEGELFGAITLTVDESVGWLVLTDGDDRKLYSKEIPFTDFPLDRIGFYLAGTTVRGENGKPQDCWVLMLNSEY